MHPDIMNLSNKLVYEGQLQLAKPEMKSRQLQLDPSWKQKVPNYLHPLIDPSFPLRFVNHDQIMNMARENS